MANFFTSVAKAWNAAFSGERQAIKVFSPAPGNVFPLKESADPAHREEALGKGACLQPNGGKLFSPCDGTVDMVFDAKHALVIKSEDGPEILIHCGIDTVKLGGQGFVLHVREGDSVKVGRLLLEYDEALIKGAGLSLETQIVVTNTADFKRVELIKAGECKAGEPLLSLQSRRFGHY
ncbi:MAG: PTS glucose transporter subunit IIA [Treponema sp.]|nr:PTS glucose transporter subunit IIA [Treponema sp.]